MIVAKQAKKEVSNLREKIDITVIYGADDVDFSTDATTVKGAIEQASGILHIPALTGLKVEVNGEKACLEDSIDDGDSIEVVKETKDKA